MCALRAIILSLSALVAWKAGSLSHCTVNWDSSVTVPTCPHRTGRRRYSITTMMYNTTYRYDCETSTQQPGRPKARTHALARVAATPRASPRKIKLPSSQSHVVLARRMLFEAGDHVLSAHINLGHGFLFGCGPCKHTAAG